MKYKIVWDEDVEKLERKVQELADKGWEPQGGVAVVAKGKLANQIITIQAMVKD